MGAQGEHGKGAERSRSRQREERERTVGSWNHNDRRANYAAAHVLRNEA